MNILVTGCDGFIAKNLIKRLFNNPKYNILVINKKSSDKDLYTKLTIADIVFQLAGVNKEIYPKYTYENNFIFTRKICSFLENNNKKPKIIYASSTQVNAITSSIKKCVSKELSEKPWHIEGLENCKWVLMDYVDVVVHVFNKETRDFYKLEELWEEAESTTIETKY